MNTSNLPPDHVAYFAQRPFRFNCLTDIFPVEEAHALSEYGNWLTARPAAYFRRSAGRLRRKGEQQDMTIAAVAYLIVVAVMSLVCFIAYGLDKRRAGNGGRRVSERALHLMAFLGGWPGALIGQRQFRHKTQKVPFRIVFWLVVVVHIGIVGAVAYRIITSA